MGRVPFTGKQRLIFALAVAGGLLLVAAFMVPSHIWASPLAILVAVIVGISVASAFAADTGKLPPEYIEAITEGRVKSQPLRLIKRLLLWVGILLLLQLGFYAVRILERT